MSVTTHSPGDVLGEPSRLVRLRRSTSHPVFAFLVRRIGAAVLTLLVASILIYLAVLVLPGNVAQVVLGRNATPQRLAQVQAQLHLDQSIPQRYLHWLGGLLTGHLGNSMASLAQGQILSVGSEIGTPLRNSLVLALITIAFFIPLCLVLGTFAALRAGSKTDHAISTTGLALGSLPEFLIGTLLIAIFFSELHLLPAVSTIAPGQTPFTNVNLLVLPVLTLLCVSVAFGTRLLRASLVEVLREDYVAMARLNGVRERRVIRRYALRNALAPSVQVVAQMIQYLLGGIIITEAVFNYPGIGTTLVQAVQVRDPQVVSVVAILLATAYIVVNILADLAVVLLVPKLRTQL
jgi:peptide/nickel transport system permease protein